ncbi:hypothetical protein OTU49_002423 [Cherax quadricarinatus]
MCAWPGRDGGNVSQSSSATLSLPSQMPLPLAPSATRPAHLSVAASGCGQPQHQAALDMIQRNTSSDHVCGFCGKNFSAPAFLRRHIRAHTGEKPFKCPHCDFRATQKGNLNSHIINRHNSPALSMLNTQPLLHID